MPTENIHIIQGSDPAVSPKKVLEDKIKYLNTELTFQEEEGNAFSEWLKTILEDRLDHYMESKGIPEWLDDHYDESPPYDWLSNTPYENVSLLNWITYSDDQKIRVLDKELGDYLNDLPDT